MSVARPRANPDQPFNREAFAVADRIRRFFDEGDIDGSVVEASQKFG